MHLKGLLHFHVQCDLKRCPNAPVLRSPHRTAYAEHAVRAEEYYTFGESTWDLVIFIGTGALGPLGSFQTFLLAVVNVLMQAPRFWGA